MYFTLSPYKDILAGMQTALAVNEGIIKLTGKPGTGKTALCCELCRELTTRGHQVVFFLNPPVSVADVQENILRQLRLNTSGNFTRQLTAHLLATETAGRTLVLIFDEAHAIDETTFTSIRMLCNIQSNTQSLVRVILCGSRMLDERLKAASFRALAQFLSQSFTLAALTREQAEDFCSAYWQHIGVTGQPLNARQMLAIYKETGGLPGALAQRLEQESATSADARLPAAAPSAPPGPAASEKPVSARQRRPVAMLMALVLLGGVGMLAYYFLSLPAQHSTQQQRPIGNPQTTAAPVQDLAAAAPSEEEQAETEQAAVVDVPNEDLTLTAAAFPGAAQATALLPESPATAAAPAAPGFSGNFSAADAEAFISSWTDSWQAQDVEGFLAHYHRDFSTPYAANVTEWRAQRSRNISNASDIRLGFDTLEIRGGSAAVQTLRFWLRYRSATYADDTLKEFILQLQDGEWRIRAERNLQILRR